MYEKNNLLWTPSPECQQASLIGRFAKRKGFKTYSDLHEWSCTETSDFWEHVWDFCDVIGDKIGTVCHSNSDMETDPIF